MKLDNGKLYIGNAVLSWRLGIRNGNAEKALSYLAPADMTGFSPAENGGVWKNEDGLTVKVEFDLIDGILQGQICYSGCNAVEEVIFPHAEVLPNEDTTLLLPASQGRLVKNVRNADTPILGDGHYTAFCFTAAYSKGKGIYFDCRDSGFHLKKYKWVKEDDKIVYSHIHYVPLDGKSEFTLPYRCGITEFEGEWFESAMIYKKWAVRQKWYKNALKDKNPLKDISMWLWNRGRIDHVIPPTERLAADAGVPIALDWYWWHHNAYDTDYPDFWPPREGVEAFQNAVKRLNDQKIYTQVYINGRTWDMDGETWQDGGDTEVEIKRDGAPHAFAFNTYNKHRLAWMCGESPIFQRKLADLVKTLCDSGLPGVYLDMIGCTTGDCCCFNPAHSHAPGGGEYCVKGFREMMETIKKENPGKYFSTEDCAEKWLDVFESMIIVFSTSNERMGDKNWEYVPAFSAIYHGANALFGSYALPDAIPPWDELWPAEDRFPAEEEQDWNKLYPCQFYLELARDITWGMQPMICNFQMKHIEDPKFAEEYKYILDTARFYYANREILYSAEMVSPGKLECAGITVDFIARGIFTHKEDVITIRKENYPAILHSVWKNPAGGRSLILVNYTPDSQDWKFEDASGTMPPRSLQRVDLQ